MFSKLTIISLVAGLAAFALSSDAEARWVQSSVYNCHATGGSKVDSSYAIANDSFYSDMVLRCDVLDISLIRKSSLHEFVVNGRDGTTTGRLSAQLCRSSYAVPGGACGYSTYSSTSDVKNEELSLYLDVFGFTWERDYGYVAIRVPPKQGSSRSSVNGIYFAQ